VRRAGANSITIANGDAYESRRGKEERGGGQAGGRAGGRAGCRRGRLTLVRSIRSVSACIVSIYRTAARVLRDA